MEIFQNHNDLEDSNNKTFIRRYTYEMQHSSFYIAKEFIQKNLGNFYVVTSMPTRRGVPIFNIATLQIQ